MSVFSSCTLVNLKMRLLSISMSCNQQQRLYLIAQGGLMYGCKHFTEKRIRYNTSNINIFAEPEVVKICKMYPSLILSHPTYCQLYYNCSIPGDSGLKDNDCKPRLYLAECPYPKLFSKETLKCENYTNVMCGYRIEIKWACKCLNLCHIKL